MKHNSLVEDRKFDVSLLSLFFFFFFFFGGPRQMSSRGTIDPSTTDARQTIRTRDIEDRIRSEHAWPINLQSLGYIGWIERVGSISK